VLSQLGARLAIRTNAALSSSELERFAQPGPELALMRRVRAQLDPEGRFAAGRFHGGL
jgi:FAD/FMN-containing dehydrogenase